jgi:hypothetical protein
MEEFEQPSTTARPRVERYFKSITPNHLASLEIPGYIRHSIKNSNGTELEDLMGRTMGLDGHRNRRSLKKGIGWRWIEAPDEFFREVMSDK